MRPIAHIRSPFGEKFGIPRQSNVVNGLDSYIVFEPEYRMPEALRGIEDFDYLWLIWQFSDNLDAGWTPTVRPPRL
ncbi:MAG: SAM-dependent methyltransferase, partial [Bacteroidales bacterium]|nr:SAM-dependent methyltransferase [Bacteroidales bacterium]